MAVDDDLITSLVAVGKADLEQAVERGEIVIPKLLAMHTDGRILIYAIDTPPEYAYDTMTAAVATAAGEGPLQLLSYTAAAFFALADDDELVDFRDFQNLRERFYAGDPHVTRCLTVAVIGTKHNVMALCPYEEIDDGVRWLEQQETQSDWLMGRYAEMMRTAILASYTVN